MNADAGDASGLLSAQVILTLGEGADGATITSENIADLLPEPQEMESVRRAFADLGFSVAAGFAGSFSIAGPVELFDAVFPSASVQHGVGSCADLQGIEVELPLSDLAESLSEDSAAVTAIVFTAPPDFGPGNP